MSEEISLDDLPIIWMEDGLPCFMADRHDICEIVESFGFNIYYVMGNQAKLVKPVTPSKTTPYNSHTSLAVAPPVYTRTSQLYRVVNNFVGRTVSPCSTPFPDDFIDIEEEATYSMPAIPHVLIDKLDQFFRLVEAQHGTESIIMLTYDTDKTGSEGWGILVPDQTNTSVHCNYDPDSIAQVKPDNVMIVGSVHSHPGMAAYASGTDHGDQADFDGVHITFGWQKSVNNGATQYYIELQMAGKSYTLTPDDVFEDYVIQKAPDPEVVAWTDKVKKVLPPKSGGSVTVSHGEAYQAPRQQEIPLTSTTVGTTNKNYNYISYPNHIQNVVENITDIDSLIVCEVVPDVDKKNYNCPACFSIVPQYNVYTDGCCNFCDVPLSEQDTSADQIIWDMFDYCRIRNIQTDVTLYLLTKDDKNDYLLLKLTSSTMDDYASSAWISLDGGNVTTSTEIDDRSDYPVNSNICCGNTSENCVCFIPVTKYDSIDFDQYLGKISIYASNSPCEVCNFYYDTNCPQYRDSVVKFMTDPKEKDGDISYYENSIDGVNCSSFSEYLYSSNHNSLEGNHNS